MKLSTLYIRASRRHADRIVSAARSMIKRFARVCQHSLDRLQRADQNVFQALNVRLTKRVSIRNVWIHVQARAVIMPSVV